MGRLIDRVPRLSQQFEETTKARRPSNPIAIHSEPTVGLVYDSDSVAFRSSNPGGGAMSRWALPSRRPGAGARTESLSQLSSGSGYLRRQ